MPFVRSRKLYSDGKIWIEEINEELSGESKNWHENGKLWIRAFYRNGNLDGKREELYSNGVPMSQQFYQNGIREGERKEWHPNGTLAFYYYFRNGKIIDRFFTWKKKYAILLLKRRLHFHHSFSIITSHVISDLAKVISGFNI